MKYVAIAGVLIIAVFLVFLIRIPKGIEPLTEVYFENHTHLPTIIFLNKSYDFSFTIHNLEYISMNYSYNVTAEYAGYEFPIDFGNFVLGNNETTTINEKFAFSGKFERAKINVNIRKELENPYQKDPNMKNPNIDIHFWVEEYQPTKIIITPD